MELADLLGMLDRRRMLRPTSADPRTPPALTWDSDDTPLRPDELGEIAPVDIDLLDDLSPDGMDMDDSDDPLDGIIERALEMPHPIEQGWPAVQTGFGLDGLEGRTQLPWRRSGRPVVDAYAWYCPFHFYDNSYGIYIRSDGITSVVRQLVAQIPTAKRSGLFGSAKTFRHLLKRAAFRYFFLHEFYHHKVESFATKLEIIENQQRFVPYQESIYRSAQHPLSNDLIEEGLAVGEVWRRLLYDPKYQSDAFWGKLPNGYSVRRLVLDLVRYEIMSPGALPPGYARASRFASPRGGFMGSEFQHEQQLLQSVIHECMLHPLGEVERWRATPHLFAGLFDKTCVAYEILIAGHSSTLPRWAAPKMQVDARKAIQIAAKWGVVKSGVKGKRSDGDHVWLESPSGHRGNIDTGYDSLTDKDWKVLLDLVNKAHGIDLKNNIAGRRAFMNGPTD